MNAIEQLAKAVTRHGAVGKPHPHKGSPRPHLHAINAARKGQKHTPITEFSARISWVRFQLKGSIGNLESAWRRVTSHDIYDKLAPNSRDAARELDARVKAAIKELKELDAEIAEFNKKKKQRKV